MSVRPFRDIKRRKTKVINVGNVKIGGDNPISVQSMTNTLTTDIKATINQINDIANEGADIVRVSCPDKDSTIALKEIVNHVPIPIVADIHFHYKRAVEAAENGAIGDLREPWLYQPAPVPAPWDANIPALKCLP